VRQRGHQGGLGRRAPRLRRRLPVVPRLTLAGGGAHDPSPLLLS
jgi:hypothetical protein